MQPTRNALLFALPVRVPFAVRQCRGGSQSRQSQHHFEVARITARAAACPTGTSSMEKKTLRRTLSHLISHKLKCARGMDVLGGWG